MFRQNFYPYRYNNYNSYNNVNYYRKDDKLYINNSELTPVENINFNIDKFKYNSIDNLIKNSDFINETEYNGKNSNFCGN